MISNRNARPMQANPARIVRWLWLASVWLVTAVYAFFAWDRMFGGPFMGTGTGFGRTERFAYSPTLALLVLVWALWLTFGCIRPRMPLFVLFGFSLIAYIVDGYFLASSFGSTMIGLTTAAVGLARERR